VQRCKWNVRRLGDVGRHFLIRRTRQDQVGTVGHRHQSVTHLRPSLGDVLAATAQHGHRVLKLPPVFEDVGFQLLLRIHAVRDGGPQADRIDECGEVRRHCRAHAVPATLQLECYGTTRLDVAPGAVHGHRERQGAHRKATIDVVPILVDWYEKSLFSNDFPVSERSTPDYST
jgi:hypothetical protein